MFLPPTGDIWIQRSTTALGPDPGHVASVAGLRSTPEWLEPLRFDVFDSDGQLLYVMEGPPGVDVRAVTGDSVLGVSERGLEGC